MRVVEVGKWGSGGSREIAGQMLADSGAAAHRKLADPWLAHSGARGRLAGLRQKKELTRG